MNLTRIHQIEMTSNCNLRCKYCVHPKMKRDKIDMDINTYMFALDMVKECMKRYGQDEVNLAGIGESTTHPEFIDFLYKARITLGPNIKIVLATNGVNVTQEQINAMRDCDVWLWVSVHRPEKAKPTIDMAARAGILKGISLDPSVNAVDWAGQVEWEVTTNVRENCAWLEKGMGMVCSDGTITTCCFDGDGLGVIGHVRDKLDTLEILPYSLCYNCHLSIPDSQLNKLDVEFARYGV